MMVMLVFVMVFLMKKRRQCEYAHCQKGCFEKVIILELLLFLWLSFLSLVLMFLKHHQKQEQQEQEQEHQQPLHPHQQP